MSVTLEQLRAMIALPGVEEGVAYGAPIFKLGKTMLARLRDDGVMVLKVDLATRDMLLDINPAVFFLEDHYVGYPLVLVRMDAADPRQLAALIEQGWTLIAPKRLVRLRQDAAG